MKIKKETIVEMYRKDPRVSRDEEVLSLKQRIIDFNPMHARNIPSLESVGIPTSTEKRQIIVCRSFSDENHNVIVSKGGRSVSSKNKSCNGYCFLNHPKIGQNQIVKWSLGVSKLRGAIGIVIICAYSIQCILTVYAAY